jgi:hypothetical protein
MTRDEVARLLDDLRPFGTLAISGDLIGAHAADGGGGFALDSRAFQAAKKFGATHKCDFRFDPAEGVGIFTKRGAS